MEKYTNGCAQHDLRQNLCGHHRTDVRLCFLLNALGFIMEHLQLFRKEIQWSGIGPKNSRYVWEIEVSGSKPMPERSRIYSATLDTHTRRPFLSEEEAELDMERFIELCKQKGRILSEAPGLQTIKPAVVN